MRRLIEAQKDFFGWRAEYAHGKLLDFVKNELKLSKEETKCFEGLMLLSCQQLSTLLGNDEGSERFMFISSLSSEVSFDDIVDNSIKDNGKTIENIVNKGYKLLSKIENKYDSSMQRLKDLIREYLITVAESFGLDIDDLQGRPIPEMTILQIMYRIIF